MAQGLRRIGGVLLGAASAAGSLALSNQSQLRQRYRGNNRSCLAGDVLSGRSKTVRPPTCEEMARS